MTIYTLYIAAGMVCKICMKCGLYILNSMGFGELPIAHLVFYALCINVPSDASSEGFETNADGSVR